ASAELRCQEDGLWSLPEAYCQLTCRAPPPMANAVARTDRCKHDGQEVGSSCKYRCEPGHHVPLTSRKGFKVRCTDSGHWEEGGCVPVQCPPLPPVLHGSYTCTQRWQLGSRCWVNCSTASASKNHTVIRCSKNGRWSGELQLCPHEQGECTAPDPPFIITCDCPTGYGIGSVCKTSCLIPHSDSVLLPENVTVPEKITAPSAALVDTPHQTAGRGLRTFRGMQAAVLHDRQRGTKESPLAYRTSLLALAKTAFPRMDEDGLWVGDGYCDPVNNNAYCHYDGGDCCVSTSAFKQVAKSHAHAALAHMVITVPASCDRKKECACRDPSAKENAQKR
ncbi:pappalysin-1-like, partial [Lethenteron reissneri]